MGKYFVVMLFVSFISFSISLNIKPICNPDEVLIDTVVVDGVEYHKIVLETYPLMIEGAADSGLPSLPYIVKTFLLPPDTEISDLTVSHEKWTALPGKYYLYPAQGGMMGDTAFILPDSLIYAWETPFPVEPVGYPSQGSALGYSVVTLTGTPVRYTPADSLVEVLTRMRVSFDLIPSTYERITPIRETELSAEVRQMNILGLVANPELISLYDSPQVVDKSSNFSGLNVLDAPSPEGDGVDMVIITSGPGDAGSDLTGAFQELADYRTAQGIITVVRTIGWIESTYSGCDLPEKIRNFIRDAHENWGVQAVILGGDDWIVPVRLYGTAGAWSYYAADDYYADIDGNWAYDDGCWGIDGTSAYVDLLVGRLPVDDSDDVQTIVDKIVTYETQPDNAGGFCRSLLLMGSEEVPDFSITDFEALESSLWSSGAVPGYLNAPLELYWRTNERPFYTSFTRSNVLQALDTGYNVAIHCDHSEIHEIGAGGDPHLSIHDYDFSTMGNQDRTGILWTIGCSPGSFVEAECFAEAGLLTDSETGFVAILANTTLGTGSDWKWSLSFCDALYSTGWTQWNGQMPVNWPLSYLGQVFRHQKNFKPISSYNSDEIYVVHHLFGDPFMFVWRGSPSELIASATPPAVTTGTQTISILVTELVMGIPTPVQDATVCIWNNDGNDVFALGRTNSSGVVTFADLEISQTGELSITATKRRDGFDVAAYMPETIIIDVNEASGPLVSMESVEVDDDNTGSSQGSNDGVLNPGETIELLVSAENSGSSTANYVTAELNVVSGGEHIANISCDQVSFPDIPSGATKTGNSPFAFTINENVESYSAIQFEIEFSYNLNQTWESPYCCSIFSESYSIPLVYIGHSLTSTQVTIDMSDFLLVNSGTGAGLDLGMTVADIYPSEPFTCNTITNIGALTPDEYTEIGNPLTLVISPDNPSTSPWTNPAVLGCSFDIQVSSGGGEFNAKSVDFDRVCNPGIFGSMAPPEIIEADDNSIEMDWAMGSGTADVIGFYLYFKENGSSSEAVRSTSLPIPVAIGQLINLDAETDYKIYVQAVDEIGRQSNAGSEVLSTTCEVSDGWPIQLAGGTGTGPVILNMDSDPEKEIVVASSFGNVYIIEPDGQMECISPPPNLSFDRFVSLSVGDVDNDGDNEIVVSCQKDIVDGDVAVLLYVENSVGIWQRNVLDDTIGPNETVCGAAATGTPVILQANDSSTLEIALRTKGSSTALHMWQWNSGLQDWIEPTGFPISLSGSFFAEPIAVDFDDDGYDELIVTQVNSNGYSELHVVDFYSGGFSEYDFQLTDLGTTGQVYSTLAAVEYDGEVYIAGVAKYSDFEKRIFVYDITAPTTGMIWYSSSMLYGCDFMGNMGGPAIGHANIGSVPDIFYAPDGMTAWQLLSEQQISYTGEMSVNVHSGIFDSVKSATIAAGTTSEYSNITVPFVGFSSKFYGHDPLDYMEVLSGFPTWTETPSWTAPVVGDVDNDGFLEVLTANASGELTLYDWNGYSTSECWPMYQHDPHRTGFFNSGRSGRGFDIELVETSLTKIVGGNAFDLFLTVKVAGSDAIRGNQANFEGHLNDNNHPEVQATESVEFCLRSSNRTQSGLMSENSLAVITPEGEIPVVVFSGRNVVGAGRIPLVDGLHEISVLLRESVSSDILTVVVDPYNSFPEVNEENNSHSVETEATGSFSDFSVSLQSPSNMISATVVVPDGCITGISFALYSLDGRLQSSSMTELLTPGAHRIDLFSADEGGNIPAGVYLVHINIGDEVTMIRKVVVL